MIKYIEASTGKKLERKARMFYWRGQWFPGLVNYEHGLALYDDPEDSFCAHVGIKSCLEEGLIKPYGQ